MPLELNDPPILETTPNLALRLPVPGNPLEYDVQGIRQAITAVDTEFANRPTLVGGKVPASQLPSYVDDVLEYANRPAFPATGEAGKIYVAIDTGKVYRWGGSDYVVISDFVLVPATPTTLGGVKVGSGLGIDPEGVLYVVGGVAGSGLPVYADQVIVPASNGQTTFTVPGGYNPGQQDIWVNGVLLEPNGDDYTASNGTTFTTTRGYNTTDTIRFRKWIYLPASMAVNKTGDTMTGALNWAPAVDVASAATTQIGLAASNRVRITGTTTITSLGTIAAGVCRTATFAGALVLTHNAASLILPGAANITTAAGDVAEFESLGGGNWRCTGYMRADGKPITASLPSGALALQAASINGGPLAGTRNVVINGDFSINQRGYVSGASTSAGQYTLDRWRVTATGGVTFATTNNKTTVTIPSGQTLQQAIEGLNLQSGTYVLSWEGTAQGRIGSGSYGMSGAVSATITGGVDTVIEFGAGTVSNVQLEPGSVATPFERLSYGAKLISCMRYFEIAKKVVVRNQFSTGFYYHWIQFATVKRAIPSFSLAGTTYTNANAGTGNAASTTGIELVVNANSVGGYMITDLLIDAEIY